MTISEPSLVGTYPCMYNNFIAASLLSSKESIETFGVLKYYDLFSLRGNWVWYEDCLRIMFLFPWELYNVYIREETGDWLFETREA